MSNAPERHPVTLKRIIHRLDGMERASVRRDVEYHVSSAGSLAFDLYRPHDAADRSIPAVLIAAGYRDVGVPLVLGCAFKEMVFVISLAQLIAASGMAAVAYTTSDPAADAGRVVDHLGRNAAALGIDPARFGVWAASGNGPVGLSLIITERRVKAAVLSNAYTFDVAGSAVADAAAAYRFANATAGKSVRDLPADVPIFLVRSGRDQFAGLNEAMDRFIADALARNLPLTIVNHRDAPHAFELDDDTPASGAIVESLLRFLRFHLGD